MPRLVRMFLPALGVAALAAALALPGAAFAHGHKGKGPKTPKPVRVACTTLSGNVAGTPTLSNCDDPTQTGGSGTFTSTLLPSGSITVTWNGTGTTTITYKTTEPHKSHCPADPTSTTGAVETEVILHGHVTGNTETDPTTDGGVKAAVVAKLCLTSTYDLSLLPPKPFKF